MYFYKQILKTETLAGTRGATSGPLDITALQRFQVHENEFRLTANLYAYKSVNNPINLYRGYSSESFQ